MKKKFIAMLMAATMVSTLLSGCGGNSSTSTDPTNTPAKTEDTAKTEETKKPDATPEKVEQGKVFNVYVWNTEFKERFEKYFQEKNLVPEGIEIKWVTTPNDNGAYQKALDAALLNQDNAAQDEKIDMFLFEADAALKYINSGYALDVKKDVGLTDDDLKDQYDYTKVIVTDKDGALRGTSWQATPGLFAYRRSIAKDVLGTDDPVEVQKALSDWTKFDEVAEKAAAKGYKMLSGYDDDFRLFANTKTKSWVDGTKIVVDDNIMKWVEQTKTYTDKGYNNKTSLWAPDWQKDQAQDGKVFGFFYSTWGINFTLLGNALAVSEKEGGKLEVGNGAFGDYAVCEGPQSYYWGGSWIAACKGTDNLPLIKEVMKTLTCDAATMKQITLDTEDYTNNKTAMNEIANSDYKSAFLGGQNHIKLFASAAEKIDMKFISQYDLGLTESFQQAFKDYFDGNVDKDTAMKNFYDKAKVRYPELTE